MDTQPKIPTLKDSQKPQVKVRGLEAGVTLFDRLKQFKKKDLAFILAGLGTLFMAPLAEHFMMSPETGDGNSLQAGWGGKGGGKGIFPDGSDGGRTPYEPGVSGLAPGGAIGGGSDIITPLNVRDPSALVMGPGATQQPPTNSVMPASPPPTAPVTHSDSDLKDALAASARGVTAAAHAAKALLPIPKIALSGGSGLRGLGVVSGGSSASGGGGPISSGGLVSGKAANGGSMAGVRGGGNISGVTRGQTSGGGGALEKLKAAGDAASNAFNRPGANAGLNEAANASIPVGNSNGGNGAGGSGVSDKAAGGNVDKNSKTVGESLAFLKQKAMQEAQIALWAKEQEAGDNKLEALKIRNTMAESVMGAVGSAVGGQVACMIVPSGSSCPQPPAGGVTSYSCNAVGASAGSAPMTPIPASQVGTSPNDCQATPADGKGAGAKNGKTYFTTDGGTTLLLCPSGSPYASCRPNGPVPKGDGKTVQNGGIKDGLGGVGGMSQSPMADLGSACTALLEFQTKLNSVNDKQQTAGMKAAAAPGGTIDKILGQAKTMVAIRDDIGSSAATGDGVPSSGDCKATATDVAIKGKTPVSSQLNAIAGSAGSLLNPSAGIVDRMNAAVTSLDPKTPDLDALGKDIGDGTTGVTGAIKTFVGDVGIVKGASDNLDKTLLTAGDPLNVDGMQLATVFQTGAATVGSGATDAVKKIQGAYQTTQATVQKLDLAANTDLMPQSNDHSPYALLQDSAQKTLTPLVASNKSADNIGGKPAMAGVPAPPLKAPDLKPTDKDAAGDGMIDTALKDINKVGGADGTAGEIKDADTKVQAVTQAMTVVTPPATTPDKACAQTPCTTAKDQAQTALDLVGTDLKQSRADQTSINAAIKNGATAAAGRVGLASPVKK